MEDVAKEITLRKSQDPGPDPDQGDQDPDHKKTKQIMMTLITKKGRIFRSLYSFLIQPIIFTTINQVSFVQIKLFFEFWHYDCIRSTVTQFVQFLF